MRIGPVLCELIASENNSTRYVQIRITVLAIFMSAYPYNESQQSRCYEIFTYRKLRRLFVNKIRNINVNHSILFSLYLPTPYLAVN